MTAALMEVLGAQTARDVRVELVRRGVPRELTQRVLGRDGVTVETLVETLSAVGADPVLLQAAIRIHSLPMSAREAVCLVMSEQHVRAVRRPYDAPTSQIMAMDEGFGIIVCRMVRNGGSRSVGVGRMVERLMREGAREARPEDFARFSLKTPVTIMTLNVNGGVTRRSDALVDLVLENDSNDDPRLLLLSETGDPAPMVRDWAMRGVASLFQGLEETDEPSVDGHSDSDDEQGGAMETSRGAEGVPARSEGEELDDECTRWLPRGSVGMMFAQGQLAVEPLPSPSRGILWARIGEEAVVCSVYLPTSGTSRVSNPRALRRRLLERLVEEGWRWRKELPAAMMVIGGDFNAGSRLVDGFLGELAAKRCGIARVVGDVGSAGAIATFRVLGQDGNLRASSTIDHLAFSPPLLALRRGMEAKGRSRRRRRRQQLKRLARDDIAICSWSAGKVLGEDESPGSCARGEIMVPVDRLVPDVAEFRELEHDSENVVEGNHDWHQRRWVKLQVDDEPEVVADFSTPFHASLLSCHALLSLSLPLSFPAPMPPSRPPKAGPRAARVPDPALRGPVRVPRTPPHPDTIREGEGMETWVLFATTLASSFRTWMEHPIALGTPGEIDAATEHLHALLLNAANLSFPPSSPASTSARISRPAPLPTLPREVPVDPTWRAIRREAVEAWRSLRRARRTRTDVLKARRVWQRCRRRLVAYQRGLAEQALQQLEVRMNATATKECWKLAESASQWVKAASGEVDWRSVTADRAQAQLQHAMQVAPSGREEEAAGRFVEWMEGMWCARPKGHSLSHFEEDLLPKPKGPTPWATATAADWTLVVEKAAGRIKMGKASGPDGLDGAWRGALNSRWLRRLTPQAEAAAVLIDGMMGSIIHAGTCVGYWPRVWREGIMVPLRKPKKAEVVTPSLFRPIVLLSRIGAWAGCAVNLWLMQWLEKEKLISPTQFGFRAGFEAGMVPAAVMLEGQMRIAEGKELHVAAMDLASAYDSTDREVLLSVLKLWGVSEGFGGMLRSMIQTSIRARVGSHLSRAVETRIGVPQGLVCSPTLFLVAMERPIRIFQAMSGWGLGPEGQEGVRKLAELFEWRRRQLESGQGSVLSIRGPMARHVSPRRSAVAVDSLLEEEFGPVASMIVRSHGHHRQRLCVMGDEWVAGLFFADDGNLVAVSAEGLQVLIHVFVLAMERSGFRVNGDKTQVLCVGRRTRGRDRWTCDGQRVRALPSVRILGVWLDSNLRGRSEWMRMQKLLTSAGGRTRAVGQGLEVSTRKAFFHAWGPALVEHALAVVAPAVSLSDAIPPWSVELAERRGLRYALELPPGLSMELLHRDLGMHGMAERALAARVRWMGKVSLISSLSIFHAVMERALTSSAVTWVRPTRDTVRACGMDCDDAATWQALKRRRTRQMLHVFSTGRWKRKIERPELQFWEGSLPDGEPPRQLNAYDAWATDGCGDRYEWNRLGPRKRAILPAMEGRRDNVWRARVLLRNGWLPGRRRRLVDWNQLLPAPRLEIAWRGFDQDVMFRLQSAGAGLVRAWRSLQPLNLDERRCVLVGCPLYQWNGSRCGRWHALLTSESENGRSVWVDVILKASRRVLLAVVEWCAEE